MTIVNPVTEKIIREAADGDTIRKLSLKTGFAYSAVYKWILLLKKYDVFELKKEGNKTKIYVKNTSKLYSRFRRLTNSIDAVEKDKEFWKLVKKTRLTVRLSRGSAVAIWTRGSYITGDFFDKIYVVEVLKKDLEKFKKLLRDHNIKYEDEKPEKSRPLVYLTAKDKFEVERIEGIPATPLKELVRWCQELYLDSVLEILDEMYRLNLKAKYAEVHTNV